jgi:hypothetical protein
MAYFEQQLAPANGLITGTLTSAMAVNGVSASNPTAFLLFTVPDGHSSWQITLNGTFSASSQVFFEGSETNGDNDWFSLNGRRNTDATTNDTTNIIDTNPTGLGANPSYWRGNTGGVKYLRVRCGTFTAADSIAVRITTSTGLGATFINSTMPTTSDIQILGTITAVSQSVILLVSGYSGWAALLTSAAGWTGTVQLQASTDGVTYFPINGAIQGNGALSTSIIGTGTASYLNQVRGSIGGLKYLQITSTAWTSGSLSITIRAGVGTAGTFLVASLPTGTNPIGNISNLTGTWGYLAGSSGTATVPAGGKVLGIAAHATTAGSLTINGGASVPVPANVGAALTPNGNLVAPSIVFSGTDSYFVEYVT